MPATGRDNWRAFARSTAAHSTLTYHETSSCQFVELSAMKRLLQSLRTEHGAYSEIFIHSPIGNGIGRLIVDPYSLLLFSSRAEDFNAINEKRSAGMTVSQAIDAVLRDRSKS